MTQRRPAALAVACSFLLTAFSLTLSRAASDPTSHISITVSDSEASQQGDGPDVSAAQTSSAPASEASSTRRYHRRTRRASSSRAGVRSVPRLPSRGAGDDGSSVVGLLGVILSDNTPIRAGRDRANRVLSMVERGQNLAISGETATDYAVLMIDHSVGYVAKNSVQLLNYQIVSDPSAATTLGLQLVQASQAYLGVPYVWGGNTKAGIDCSGFVKAVYETIGIELPRVSGDQATVGFDVPHNVAAGDWMQWAPGDRMYFACHHPRIDHTAMYIGNGLFIHASMGHNQQVAIDRVDNAYYSAHLVAVRRSKQLLREQPMPGDGRMASAPSLDAEANQQ